MKEIRNFVQLTDKLGTAGQPEASQFELIADAGFEAVINLALPEHEDSIDSEGAIVTGLGMDYIHIPVHFDAPTPEQLRKFCAILKGYGDSPVFVHCIMNYRVSAFMYHYLTKVLGYDAQSAKSEMFHRWNPNPVWQEVMNWDKVTIGLD
ncbi:MAG: phosphatase [Gammaproteobacteria bacterium]|nr:phosphatase [Gammaproteobacteria bacterium]NKB63593.1 phosphatase [Gammaproteobacteria bacterium]NKB64515.1 phosphatase [Gammaproteobacteria bacterium]